MSAALTKSQLDWLDKVCRTNGGGVAIRCRINSDGHAEPVNTAMRALYRKGLIQGKSGAFETVVHTRDGLTAWREATGGAA